MSAVVLFLCLTCELSDNSEVSNQSVAKILTGTWLVKVEISVLTDDLKWQSLDDNFVNRYYTIYGYWDVDTAGKVIKKSVACDFLPFIQDRWSLISDKTLEFNMGSYTCKITSWQTDDCIIQSMVSQKERHTYNLSRIINNYNTADYRDPCCGEYKGHKRTWLRGMGGVYTETYDSNLVVTVSKLKCSPDQIRLNSSEVFSLQSSLSFGYNKLPDGISYLGKFSNGNTLEINISGFTNEYGSSFKGIKTK